MIDEKKLAEWAKERGCSAAHNCNCNSRLYQCKETLSAALKAVRAAQDYKKEIDCRVADPILRKTLRDRLWEALAPFRAE